jgi:hypothetical protein
MIREQMINFLQTAIVFLLLTNAITALTAMYAMRMMKAMAQPGNTARRVVEQKLDAILSRAA